MASDGADRDPKPLISAPFEAEEVERILRVVDERVRFRASSAPGVQIEGSEPPADAPLDPATTFEGESLVGLAAPLFHLGKGGPLGRLAKTVLNVPLRVLGRPQLHFNDALRRVIRSWADVLGATLDNLAALQRDVASQRARLAELEARLARLERDGHDPPRS